MKGKLTWYSWPSNDDRQNFAGVEFSILEFTFGEDLQEGIWCDGIYGGEFTKKQFVILGKPTFFFKINQSKKIT